MAAPDNPLTELLEQTPVTTNAAVLLGLALKASAPQGGGLDFKLLLKLVWNFLRGPAPHIDNPTHNKQVRAGQPVSVQISNGADGQLHEIVLSQVMGGMPIDRKTATPSSGTFPTPPSVMPTAIPAGGASVAYYLEVGLDPSTGSEHHRHRIRIVAVSVPAVVLMPNPPPPAQPPGPIQIALNATVHGGAAPYKFEFIDNATVIHTDPTNTSGVSTFTTTYGAGTHVLEVRVTDNIGQIVNSASFTYNL